MTHRIRKAQRGLSMVESLVALVVSAVLGFVLLRGGRAIRAGGLGHAHVLA